MPSIIQNLFRDHFDAYAAAHGASGDQYRAANAIIACRTPALGGHVQGCPLGHEERLILHSCRHRSCPQCQGIERARWLEDTSERLLECTHHHLIFTIPHSLNALWMHNRRVLAEALFGAAHEALSELLDDPRYLGARPGVLLALHTWGRNLALHPHIHALVSDGGFDGEIWCPARRRHFLPARVLMALFRGKFLARHQAGIDAGEIVLPAALSPDDARRLLGRCARQRWNVHLRTGYAHGEGVVRYLARYVRGGATQSSQIVAVTAQQITLRYHAHDSDGEEASWRLLHLTPDAFIQRTLQHVPPARAHQVRRYGLYAGRAGEARERARRALTGRAVPAAETPTPAGADTPLATQTGARPATRDWRRYLAGVPAAASCTCCATCASPIVWLRAIPPQRPPPGRPRPIV